MLKLNKSRTVYKCEFCSSEHRTKKEAEKCFNGHKNKICVSCHKPITTTHLWFDHATSFKLHCWYGSSHDMTVYDLVICDECLDRYLEVSKEKGELCPL